MFDVAISPTIMKERVQYLYYLAKFENKVSSWYFGHAHNSYNLHIKDAKYNEGIGKVKVKFQNIFDIDRPQAF